MRRFFSINVSVIKSKGDSYFILSMKMKMVSPRSTSPGLREISWLSVLTTTMACEISLGNKDFTKLKMPKQNKPATLLNEQD